MQTTTSNGISNITAQLAVGSNGANMRAAGLVAERIDHRTRILKTQGVRIGLTLADSQSLTVQNVIAIKGILLIDAAGNAGQVLLLIGHRYTLENTVIAAADGVFLVSSKVGILGNNHKVNLQVSCDPLNGGSYLISVDGGRGFGNDMADAVADENLHSNSGVNLRIVCNVYNGSGDSVRHLIGVGGITFST